MFAGASRIPTGGRCYLAIDGSPSTPGHVTYPFTSPLSSASFDRTTLVWSGRTEPYDISLDGVAHIGMIPDFVEELKVVGLTNEDLEPLWNGAEAYLRAWEGALAWAPSYGREVSTGKRAACRAIRSELLESGDDKDVTLAKWADAVTRLRSQGCDAVVGGPAPTPASITVSSVRTSQGDRGGSFNLQIDGETKAANVESGTTGSVPVSAGVHRVSVTAGTGTSMSNYRIAIGGACAPDGTVAVQSGEQKSCTVSIAATPRASCLWQCDLDYTSCAEAVKQGGGGTQRECAQKRSECERGCPRR
jgi:hypothetical protein